MPIRPSTGSMGLRDRLPGNLLTLLSFASRTVAGFIAATSCITATADVVLEYVGPPLIKFEGSLALPAQTKNMRATIVLYDGVLGRNGQVAGTNIKSLRGEVFKSAELTDGLSTRKFKLGEDLNGDLSIETDARGEVSDWQIRLGDNYEDFALYGPGSVRPTRVSSEPDVPGPSRCPNADVVYSRTRSFTGLGDVATHYRAIGCGLGTWKITRGVSAESIAGSNAKLTCEVPPKPGDVVIYRRGPTNDIQHSAVITKVTECTVVETIGKLDATGVIAASSPDAPFLSRYGSWTAYATTRYKPGCVPPSNPCRGSANDHNRIDIKFSEDGTVTTYFTDKGRKLYSESLGQERINEIWQTFQCHGYTFGGLEASSSGIPGGIVQLILNDNDYRQIHALDSRGVNRYDPRFGPR